MADIYTFESDITIIRRRNITPALSVVQQKYQMKAMMVNASSLNIEW
jgi:hypothetical protein